jgi:hypothetical protein
LPGLLGNFLGGFANQGGQNIANKLTGHGLIPRKVMYNNHPHWVVHGEGIGSWLSGAMGKLRQLLGSSPVRRVGGVALGHVTDAFQHALSSKLEDLSNKGAEYGKAGIDRLAKHVPFVGEKLRGHLREGVDEFARQGRRAANRKIGEHAGRARTLAKKLREPLAAPRPTLKAPNAMDHESEDDDVFEGRGLHRKRAAHTIRSLQCAKKRKMLHHNKQRQLAHLIY